MRFPSHPLHAVDVSAVSLYDTALAKIRSGDHDAVTELIDSARSAPDHDATTSDVLDAARCLARSWSRLIEDSEQHERALAQSKARASAIADELVRVLSMAQVADTTAQTRPGAIAAHIGAEAIDPSQAETRVSAESKAEPTAESSILTTPSPIVPRAGVGAIDGHPGPALCTWSVRVQLLGPFRVVVNDQPIEDWPNGKTKVIFKYLLLNRHRPIAREALMELFWPDLDPEAARNNLNVAIHRLRRTLSRGSGDAAFVLFADGHYVLNPRFGLRTDADQFEEYLQRALAEESAGRADAASSALRRCVELYQNELLAEDRYETWIEAPRQRLRDSYLDALGRLCRYRLTREEYAACTASCGSILAVDSCNEEAHRMLMRCYARMSQPHLATQQYQTCVRTLARELGISPSADTTAVYREIAQCALM